MTGCHIVTLSDGSQVRVNGEIDLDYLEELNAAVKAREASRCHALSDVAMPAIAQRMHDRETYRCARPRGHDGPHRWPEDGTRAEWGP